MRNFSFLFLISTLLVLSPTQAATISTTQAQWNLAGLGYLSYTSIDGISGPKTAGAASSFQTDRCIDSDGVVGSATSDALVNLMKQVQA